MSFSAKHLLLSEACPHIAALRQLYVEYAEHTPKGSKGWAKDLFDVDTEGIRRVRVGVKAYEAEDFIADIKRINKCLDAWLNNLPEHGEGHASAKALRNDFGAIPQLLKERKTTVYDIGARLGYETHTDIQYELDQYFYRKDPLLNCAFYNLGEDRSRKTAQSHANDYVGLYNVYMQRGYGSDTWWLCPMRVRYLFEIRRRKGEVSHRSAFIRVKLTLYRAQKPERAKDWDYDGALIVLGKSNSVKLERRREDGRDLFDFTFGEPTIAMRGNSSTLVWRGNYVTTDQVDYRVIGGEVIVEKTHGANDRGFAPEDPVRMNQPNPILKGTAEYSELQALRHLWPSRTA